MPKPLPGKIRGVDNPDWDHVPVMPYVNQITVTVDVWESIVDNVERIFSRIHDPLLPLGPQEDLAREVAHTLMALHTVTRNNNHKG